MRTKEQIMQEVKRGGVEFGQTSIRDNLALLIEVLIDIRDNIKEI